MFPLKNLAHEELKYMQLTAIRLCHNDAYRPCPLLNTQGIYLLQPYRFQAREGAISWSG